MYLLLQGPAGGLAQPVRVHHDALAIGGDDQDPVTAASTSARPAVEGIEVLTQVHCHLFALALRHLPASRTLQMCDRLIERPPNHLIDQRLAQFMRVLVQRQIQLGIQWEDALQATGPIASARDRHFSEAGLQATLATRAPVGPGPTVCTDYPFAYGLLRTPLIQEPLSQSPQQLHPFTMDHRLHLSVRQPLGVRVLECTDQMLELLAGSHVVGIDLGAQIRVRWHRRGLPGRGHKIGVSCFIPQKRPLLQSPSPPTSLTHCFLDPCRRSKRAAPFLLVGCHKSADHQIGSRQSLYIGSTHKALCLCWMHC